MKIAVNAAVFCAAILAAPLSFAQGDVDAGKIKADTCLGCHGIPGYNNVYPTYRVPLIGGQPAGYIEAALKAYRTGDRKHATMHAQANTLTDQDIADIAAYLSVEGK